MLDVPRSNSKSAIMASATWSHLAVAAGVAQTSQAVCRRNRVGIHRGGRVCCSLQNEVKELVDVCKVAGFTLAMSGLLVSVSVIIIILYLIFFDT